MNEFLSWDSLLVYANFVSTVYLIVEFTKEIEMIKKIPTKYWSFFISFILLICTHLALNVFLLKDLFLYFITSMAISVGANGISDFNK